jgi:hypothetical protein
MFLDYVVEHVGFVLEEEDVALVTVLCVDLVDY